MDTQDLHGILWREDEPHVCDTEGRLIPESEAVAVIHEEPGGIGPAGVTWSRHEEYTLRRA